MAAILSRGDELICGTSTRWVNQMPQYSGVWYISSGSNWSDDHSTSVYIMSIFILYPLAFCHGLWSTTQCNRLNQCYPAAIFLYSDVIMDAMAPQITSLMIVYSTVYSGTDQRKRQSSASLAFAQGIHRWPLNSSHKWPVTRKCFHLMTSSYTH